MHHRSVQFVKAIVLLCFSVAFGNSAHAQLKATYSIEIKTADVKGAGNEFPVYINMKGDKGKETGWLRLPDSDRKEKMTFKRTLTDIGHISSIRLDMHRAPGTLHGDKWVVDWVKVNYLPAGPSSTRTFTLAATVKVKQPTRWTKYDAGQRADLIEKGVEVHDPKLTKIVTVVRFRGNTGGAGEVKANKVSETWTRGTSVTITKGSTKEFSVSAALGYEYDSKVAGKFSASVEAGFNQAFSKETSDTEKKSYAKTIDWSFNVPPKTAVFNTTYISTPESFVGYRAKATGEVMIVRKPSGDAVLEGTSSFQIPTYDPENPKLVIPRKLSELRALEKYMNQTTIRLYKKEMSDYRWLQRGWVIDDISPRPAPVTPAPVKPTPAPVIYSVSIDNKTHGPVIYTVNRPRMFPRSGFIEAQVPGQFVPNAFTVRSGASVTYRCPSGLTETVQIKKNNTTITVPADDIELSLANRSTDDTIYYRLDYPVVRKKGVRHNFEIARGTQRVLSPGGVLELRPAKGSIVSIKVVDKNGTVIKNKEDQTLLDSFSFAHTGKKNGTPPFTPRPANGTTPVNGSPAPTPRPISKDGIVALTNNSLRPVIYAVIGSQGERVSSGFVQGNSNIVIRSVVGGSFQYRQADGSMSNLIVVQPKMDVVIPRNLVSFSTTNRSETDTITYWFESVEVADGSNGRPEFKFLKEGERKYDISPKGAGGMRVTKGTQVHIEAKRAGQLVYTTVYPMLEDLKYEYPPKSQAMVSSPNGRGFTPTGPVVGGPPNGSAQPLSGLTLASVEKYTGQTLAGYFKLIGPKQWQEQSAIDSGKRDYTEVQRDQSGVYLKSGSMLLKLDLEQRAVVMVDANLKQTNPARYYELKNPRNAAGEGETPFVGGGLQVDEDDYTPPPVTASFDPTGIWLKGPPGIKFFEPSIAIFTQLQKTGAGLEMRIPNQPGVSRYAFDPTQQGHYIGTTGDFRGQTFNISSFELTAADANTLIQKSFGNTTYLRRNITGAQPPTPTKHRPDGVWLRGPKDIVRFTDDQATRWEFRSTAEGIEMIRLTDRGVATYSHLAGTTNMYMGQKIVSNTGQEGTPANMKSWRIVVVSPDLIVQTSNGSTYQFRRTANSSNRTPVTGGQPANQGRQPMISNKVVSVHVTNSTPHPAQVVMVGPNEEESPVGIFQPGQSESYPLNVGSRWIYKISTQKGLVERPFTVEDKPAQEFVITLTNVSVPQTAPVVSNKVVFVQITNSTPYPAQVFTVGPDGQRAPVGIFQTGQSEGYPLNVGSQWVYVMSTQQGPVEKLFTVEDKPSQTFLLSLGNGFGQPPSVRPQGGGAMQSGATGSKMTSQEAQTMVAAHNRERGAVGVGPVTWSPEIARHAQQWADQLAAQKTFYHRPSNKYGENISYGYFSIPGRGQTASAAAEYWAAEKANYTYGASFTQATGHYTQMVWSRSTQIGCGKAEFRGTDGNYYTVYVCNYNPAGNITGQNPY